MSLFATRKPRGFNHHYIYVDERKERIEQIERRAKRELGMPVDGRERTERIRGTFGRDTLRRRKRTQMKIILYYLIGLMLLFLVLMGLSYLF